MGARIRRDARVAVAVIVGVGVVGRAPGVARAAEEVRREGGRERMLGAGR